MYIELMGNANYKQNSLKNPIILTEKYMNKW